MDIQMNIKLYFLLLCLSTLQISFIASLSPAVNTGNKVQGVTLKIAFDSSSNNGNDNNGPSSYKYGGVADNSSIKSERFTSPTSLDMVHRLRRESDCVLVGKGTVAFDDCTLTVRRVPMDPDRAQPARVVIDPSLSLLLSNNSDGVTNHDDDGDNLQYKMFQDGHQVIVYYCDNKNNVPLVDYPSCVHFVKVPDTSDASVFIREDSNHYPNDDKSVVSESPSPKISPAFIVEDLRNNFDIHHVMIEGGPSTALLFLQTGAVDRAIIVKSPICFKDPVPSHMSHQTMIDAGLTLLGCFTNKGGDEIECWARNGACWPNDGTNLESWP